MTIDSDNIDVRIQSLVVTRLTHLCGSDHEQRESLIHCVVDLEIGHKYRDYVMSYPVTRKRPEVIRITQLNA
ncbi:hypothetical protein J6590_049868 [Homalodisca vitripennis]|nr:hypothetical protein J6590_049868 [Homalodisca vitripennis]